MPADANPYGDIFGGWLMGHMDLAAGSVASRHAQGRAVTITVEGMKFHRPVVVGDEVATSRPVRFVREDPPGGGPAAALLAGLDAVGATGAAGAAGAEPTTVVVLAVDMPLVSAATIDRLLLSAAGDGALLVDDEGRRQLLCGAYSVAALRAAAPPAGSRTGLPVRRLLADLDLVEVPALAREAHDVDEWADLERLRREVAPRPPSDPAPASGS